MPDIVVVASQTEAKIFRRNRQGMKLLKLLENKQGRLKERDLREDKPGVSYAKAASNQSPHNLVEQVSQREKIAERFAKRIAMYLHRLQSSIHFDRLMLVAGPRFLGLLDQQIQQKVRKLEVDRINKNLSRVTTDAVLAEIERQEAG